MKSGDKSKKGLSKSKSKVEEGKKKKPGDKLIEEEKAELGKVSMFRSCYRIPAY